MSATTVRRPLGRWWDGRTLLWRLVAGLLALLLVTCAVVGVTTTLALRGFLLDRLDRQLGQGQVIGPIAQGLDAARLPGAGGGPPGGFAADGDRGPGRGGDDHRDDDGGLDGALGALVVDGRVARATVLRRGDGLQVVPTTVGLDAADRAALAALPLTGRPSNLSLDGGTYRATALPSGGDVLVVALPTDGVRATTSRLVAIEVVVFAVAIALAALAGAAAVRVALRPLRRVAATAGAVAATPMGSGEVVMPAGVAQTDERTEVGQVGAAFNLMLGRVGGALAQRQATEERLRRFVADASHELRTPLAVIRGHSELAGRRAGELPAEVAHALDRVHAESLRMGALVDDLLLLARLDAGRPLAREEVDLTRLVLDATSDARAADGAAAARPAHRWRMELPEEPVTVVGDAHRLHQVLANLLSNARTHTPPGTTVTVVLELEASGAALRVVDDGPGVPDEVADHVFERFVRADASRTRAGAPGPSGPDGPDGPEKPSGPGDAGSSGLGLAIVDAVVAAHGGTVALERGAAPTTFRVVLPLVPPA